MMLSLWSPESMTVPHKTATIAMTEKSPLLPAAWQHQDGGQPLLMSHGALQRLRAGPAGDLQEHVNSKHIAKFCADITCHLM